MSIHGDYGNTIANGFAMMSLVDNKHPLIDKAQNLFTYEDKAVNFLEQKLDSQFDMFTTQFKLGLAPKTEDKKESHHKVAWKKVLEVTGGGAVLAVVGVAILSHQKGGKFSIFMEEQYKKLSNKFENWSNNLKLNSQGTWLERNVTKISDSLNHGVKLTAEKYTDINQLKDHLLERGLLKIPFVKFLMEKGTNAFISVSRKPVEAKYNKFINKKLPNFRKNITNFIELEKGTITKEDKAAIDTFLNETEIGYKELSTSFKTRFNKLKEDFNNFEVKFYADITGDLKAKELFTKEGMQKVKNNFSKNNGEVLSVKLRKEEVNNKKEALNKIVGKTVEVKDKDGKVTGMVSEQYDALIKQIETKVESAKTEKEKEAYLKLKTRLENFNKKMDEVLEFEHTELDGRIRDLKLGGILTEMLGPVLSTVILIREVIKGDTKEEKISALIKTGFPIVGGLGAWAYTSLLRNINGIKGLAIGSAATIALGVVGKALDKKVYQKYFVKPQAVTPQDNTPKVA